MQILGDHAKELIGIYGKIIAFIPSRESITRVIKLRGNYSDLCKGYIKLLELPHKDPTNGKKAMGRITSRINISLLCVTEHHVGEKSEKTQDLGIAE